MAIKKLSKKYITKHDKFIDYRISLISEFLYSKKNDKSISPQHIIEQLLDDKKDLIKNKVDNFTYEAIIKLKEMIETWDILLHGDIVGYIYQEIQSSDDKKNKGQFFTPSDIVSEMVESSLENFDKLENIKIIDPACGSGQFLIESFKYLYFKYTENGIAVDKAISNIINNNLHGVDIDPTATKIAKYNLSRLSGYSENRINIRRQDFLLRDDLNFQENQLKFKFYDIIIGNPPWGSKLNNIEKKYYRKSYHSIKSGINTFTLFIERAFDFVKDGGKISYLIPEAFLNVKAHKNSREFVLENSIVEKLSTHGERFKGVFTPSISLQLQSELDHLKRKKNIVSINTYTDDKILTLVPQDSFHHNYDCIFNVNYSRKAVDIIEKMNLKGSQTLNNSKFFLGIVTGDNTKHISSKQSENYPDPILIGKDLSQYNVNFSNNYFNFNPDSLQQVAPQNLYKSPDKILYKFIGKRLTFAIDDTGYYSLNNVNGFVPKLYDIDNKSALSVLNSKLMQYYYEKNFFTLKVLKGNLERLPLIKIDSVIQNQLGKLVQELNNCNSNRYEMNRENLEDIIYHQYGINDRDAYIINEQVR